jgi:hypothetical protein
MRYRKKPVVIEAELFKTNNDPDENDMNSLVEWINIETKNPSLLARHDGTQIYIVTLEGTMTAQVGDYIIKGVQGEFYPCKPDIFEATYEPVEATQ